MLILEKIIKTFKDKLQFFSPKLYHPLSSSQLPPILLLSLILQSSSRDLLDIELQSILHRTKPKDHILLFRNREFLKKISQKSLFRRYVETLEIFFPEISEIVYLRLLSVRTPFVGTIFARRIDRNPDYYLECYSRFVNMEYGLGANITLKKQILLRGKRFICKSKDCDGCEGLLGKYRNNKALLKLIQDLARDEV